MLSKQSFIKATESIMKYGRPLEKSIYQYYFNEASGEGVLTELKGFQNKDGGFGNGIESDFRLPNSSPMATSVGIRLLSQLDHIQEAREMIKKAIGYLEASYSQERDGWYTVGREVNDFPHAPWWHFNEDEGMTIIDRNWGNPSAEIVAYLYKYREYANKLDVDALVEYALDYIQNKQEFKSEFEIFCFKKLYEVLPEEQKIPLEKRIILAIKQLIIYDEEEWQDYVPTPLDFVDNPEGNSFEILESKIEDNLNFLINELESRGAILPPWGEGFYLQDLKEAYNEWIGVLTFKALVTLNKFHKIIK